MRRALLLPAFLGVLLTVPLVTRGQSVSVSLHVDVSAPMPRSKAANPMNMVHTVSPVVVWLSPTGGSSAETSSAEVPAQSLQLTQKNKQFVPHLLVVPTGASVEFPNLDPFFHNVFSLFNGRRFDLGLYEAGSRRSVQFSHPGVSYIFCNIHPEMGAIIISVSTPYYAISGKDGSVVLQNVPPGEYDLHVWSENVAVADLAAARQHIRVAGENVRLAPLTFKQNSLQMERHLNKYGEPYSQSGTDPY
jgi:plastocyanin